LEEELGVTIFTRNGKSLSGITEQGKIILEKAEAIMQTINEIKALSDGLKLENVATKRSSIPNVA
jgi:LysR family cys regulon transcriptional activator